MRMFIISKNKYLSNDMTIFGTCSIASRFTWSMVQTTCYQEYILMTKVMLWLYFDGFYKEGSWQIDIFLQF